MNEYDFDQTKPLRRRRILLLGFLVLGAMGFVQLVGKSGHESWLKHGPLKEVGKFVAENPGDSESAYRYAYRQVQEGEAKEAVSVMETVIKDHPREPRYLYGIARAHSLMGHSLESEKYLKQVLEIDPQNATAMADLGNMYTEAKLYSEADALYRRAEKIDPKAVGNSVLHGKTLIGLGKLDEAWECLKNGIKAMPILDEAFPLLTDIAFQKNRLDQMEAMCWKRLGISAVYPFGKVRNSLLRVILADVKRPTRITEAEDQAIIAIQDSAPEAAFFVGMARVKMLQKDWDLAGKAIKKAIEINSKDLDALKVGAELAGLQGNSLKRDQLLAAAKSVDIKTIVRDIESLPDAILPKMNKLRTLGLPAEAAELAYRHKRAGTLDANAEPLISVCHEEALKILASKAGPIGDELRRPQVGT